MLGNIGTGLKLIMSIAGKKVMGLFDHIMRKKQHRKTTDTRKGRKQAMKGKTYKDLVPRFKRLDKTGPGMAADLKDGVRE